MRKKVQKNRFDLASLLLSIAFAIGIALDIPAQAQNCLGLTEQAKSAILSRDFEKGIPLADSAVTCYQQNRDTVGWGRAAFLIVYAESLRRDDQAIVDRTTGIIEIIDPLKRDDPSRAQLALTLLAEAHMDLGYPKESAGCFQECAELMRGLYQRGKTDRIRDFYNKAVAVELSAAGVLAELGRPEATIDYMQQARVYLDEIKDPRTLKTRLAFYHFTYSKIEKQRFNYPAAFDHSFEAIRLYESLGEDFQSQLWDVRSDLALLYGWVGNRENEEALFRELMNEIEGESKGNEIRLARIYDNLARCLTLQGQYETALPWHEKSFEWFEKKFPANSYEAATVLINQGMTFRKLGRIQEHRKNLKRALPIFQEGKVAKMDMEWIACLELGKGFVEEQKGDSALVYLKRGYRRLLEAEEIDLKKGLTLDAVSRLSREYPSFQYEIGRALRQMYVQYRKLDFLRLSMFHFGKSIEYYSVRERVLPFQSVSTYQFNMLWQGGEKSLQNLVERGMDLYEETGEKLLLRQTLLFIDLSRANRLRQAAQDQRRLDPNRVEQEFGEWKALMDLRREVQSLEVQLWKLELDTNADQSTKGSLESSLISTRQRYEQKLRQTDPRANVLDGRKLLGRKLDQLKLSRPLFGTQDSTAFLEYFIGKDEVLVFVVTEQGIGVKQLGKTEHLLPQIDAFNKYCSTNPYHENLPKPSLVAQDLVPFDLLPTSISRLVIVSDSSLGRLAFSALPLGLSSERRLVHQYTVTHDYSIEYHLQSRQLATARTHTKKGCAFYPFHQSLPGLNLNSIRDQGELAPFTSGQGMRMSFYHNSDATKAAVQHCLQQANICHLATHGFQSENSSDSLSAWTSHGAHLVFRKGNHLDKLYEYEIASIESNRCRLVTLGACQTFVGGNLPGEGNLSLARSFRMGVTPSVLASRWLATTEINQGLHHEFYSQMVLGVSLDRCLARSQRNYLASLPSKDKGRHPYFWAHLTLNGARSGVKW